MASDIISANYQALEEIATKFSNESERIRRVEQVVSQKLNALQSGGWLADAATAFYREMESDVCPAIQRFQAALTQASQTCREISNVLKQAEEEAAQCLPRQ